MGSLGQDDYDFHVAEATVLARLGALLHDLCQIPFGHSIEDDLQVLIPHDTNGNRFDILWDLIPQDVRELISEELYYALRHVILPKEKLVPGKGAKAASQYLFVADIVGNTICADLIDYLERDHQFMGLPAKLGHRFIDGFYVTRSDALYYPQRMAIQITREGRLRADVITELFKFLRYRYELSERGLVHHAKLAADAMMGKTLDMWNDVLRVAKVVRLKPELARFANDIDAVLAKAKRLDVTLPSRVQQEAQAELEQYFLRHGDDGLLESLLEWANSDTQKDGRKTGIALLTRSILERKLYKLAGKTNQASRSMAREIWNKYGGFEQRRRLEEEVARYVGLEHRWQVILWIPSPEMRLKAAEVLVDTGGQIMPLKEYDRATMERGKDIYKSHEALWAVSVYVHPTLADGTNKKQVILAWLRNRLGVEWEEAYKPKSLEQLAAEQIAVELKLQHAKVRELAIPVAAYRGENTFDELCTRLRNVAKSWSQPDKILNTESQKKTQKLL